MLKKLLAGAVFAAALGMMPALAEDVTVRLLHVNQTGDKFWKQAAENYNASHPGVKVIVDYMENEAYKAKLPTLLQSDDRPDIIYSWAGGVMRAQIEAGYIEDISAHKADFEKTIYAAPLNAYVVDGKLYGISIQLSEVLLIYNKALLDKLGVTLPDPTKWTVDDFAAIGNDLKGKLPDGMYFVSNFGGQENMLETWMRQRGKALYTEDGKLAFDVDDMTAFWEHWYKMLEAGLTPPADVQAQDTGKMEEMMLLTKHSLFDFLHSNQLVAAQKLSPDELGMTMIPNQVNGKAGQYMKPSMLISMAETSQDKEGAAKLMNFFLTDEGANDILLIERGVTGDASIRKHIAPKLTATENKIIDYLNVVAGWVGPLPPPPPKGAGEIDRAIEPAWQAVAFKQKKVDAAAKEFYDFCKQTLERS